MSSSIGSYPIVDLQPASGTTPTHPKALILVVHTTARGLQRRMWNPAAVEAVLKLHFPSSAGYIVAALDASAVGPANMAVLSRLFAQARVVVTGVGLYNLHHVLLPPDAAVVDVESCGVSWEDLELQVPIHEEFKRQHVSPYQRVLAYGGVYDLRGSGSAEGG